MYTLLQVLHVLFASVIRLRWDEQDQLRADLIKLIELFALPPELISTAVDVATVVCDVEAGGEKARSTDAYGKKYQGFLDKWAAPLIKTIDDVS